MTSLPKENGIADFAFMAALARLKGSIKKTLQKIIIPVARAISVW